MLSIFLQGTKKSLRNIYFPTLTVECKRLQMLTQVIVMLLEKIGECLIMMETLNGITLGGHASHPKMHG